MKVTVCGPNLRDQSKGYFHVHAADCRDLITKRPREPEYAHGWTFDAETQIEVVEDVYADIIAEDENGWTPGMYLNDLWFAPCCDALPVCACRVEPTDEPCVVADGEDVVTIGEHCGACGFRRL